MKHFFILFACISLFILAVFGIWGDGFESLFNQQDTQQLLESVSLAAGPLGALLLISDIFLPIPTTVVIGAMGATLGTAAGAAWGWLGLTLAGWTGYGLARWGKARWRHRLISPEEEERFGSFFDRKGGLTIVLSRMLPILPEVLSILAGLYGMTPKRFGIAVTLGSLPPALIFSWIGASARDAPLRALILLTALTAALWLVYVRLCSRASEQG